MENYLSTLSSQPQNLYEKVAEYIANLIKEGTLQPGDRLPSVRKLHRQLAVSISTVLEAYRLLEDRHLVIVRPQSGYYVKKTISVAEPSTSKPDHHKADFIDTSLAFQVRTAIDKPHLVKLGAAIPHPSLFPVATLNRLIGQVIRDRSELVHSYNIPMGCVELRQQVAKRLIDAGCSVNPNQVVITNGATEAIFLALKAVTKPGDTVAIESPTYYGLLEALESLHLKALELPTHPRNGISLEHLASACQKQQVAACAIVSNYSNPLGSCMSTAKKQQLVSLINQYDIPLIEDDIFGDLYFSDRRPQAVKAFDTQGKVLYCASVSKTLSPGLRVGWIIAEAYQQKIEQLKAVMNYSSAIAPQLTVAAFLANGGYDRHLRKLRHAYRSQMQHTLQAIYEYFPTDTKVTQPQGGHILWLELPPQFNSMRLYQQAYQQNISIAPGVIFSASESYGNCLRLNCGIPWSDSLEKAIAKLGVLSKQQLI
ncbi:MAG: PLP-dependent aminotransferase family protein [Xenococcaceae cyanobacterium]